MGRTNQKTAVTSAPKTRAAVTPPLLSVFAFLLPSFARPRAAATMMRFIHGRREAGILARKIASRAVSSTVWPVVMAKSVANAAYVLRRSSSLMSKRPAFTFELKGNRRGAWMRGRSTLPMLGLSRSVRRAVAACAAPRIAAQFPYWMSPVRLPVKVPRIVFSSLPTFTVAVQ